jgi:hypothetical protein
VGSEVQVLPGPLIAVRLCRGANESGCEAIAGDRSPEGRANSRGALLAPGRMSFGGVAQLGEHLLCKQGVIGSNPFTSIQCRFALLSVVVVAKRVWLSGLKTDVEAEEYGVR